MQEDFSSNAKRIWNKIRPFMMVIISISIVIIICFIAYGKLKQKFFQPFQTDAKNEVTIEVKSGWGTNRIATALYGDSPENQLIQSKALFKVYVDFVGKGRKMRAGSYTFQQGDSMEEIVSTIAAGDSDQVRSIKFTLTEGMTVEDMADRLVLDGVLESKDEFLALAKTGTEFSEFDIPLDHPDRHYALEGYLFPDTYDVYEGTTAKAIIQRLLLRFNEVINATYYERMEEMDISLDDVITLASIIEKEAQTDDFAQVSAVLQNRLSADMPLQSDATIRYELDTDSLRLTSEQLAIESKYNSHLNKGLPAGPICNPGKAAIEAALYPDQTMLTENYLYFTLQEPTSGKLAFSKTLAEHDELVATYKYLWEAYDVSRASASETENAN